MVEKVNLLSIKYIREFMAYDLISKNIKGSLGWGSLVV